MNTFATRNNKNKLIHLATPFMGFILLILASLGLQGCFLDDDDGPTPTNPNNGYYDAGTIDVLASTLEAQGIVKDNRFFLLTSNIGGTLVYDISISEITDNNYTGSVVVYVDGVISLPNAGISQTITGVINQGVTITGTVVGTSNAQFDSTFTLNYSLNNSNSALTRVAKNWQGPINLAPDTVNTVISDSGVLSRDTDQTFPANTPALNGCVIDSTSSSVQPVASQSVYNVNVTLTNCTDTDANSGVSGVYTGFAATQTVADETLIIIYNNGSFSGSGILPFNP